MPPDPLKHNSIRFHLPASEICPDEPAQLHPYIGSCNLLL